VRGQHEPNDEESRAVSRFDATPPRREATNSRDDQNTPAVPIGFVEDLVPTQGHSTLARGIVWSDVVADIAADERARQLRDAA
jgi:hypothetical protein